MKVTHCDIGGLLLIEPNVFADVRGLFVETWSDSRYREAGLEHRFVQDNLSLSKRGTVRGLHFQNPRSQGKLVYVIEGEVFDVAVDLRKSSPTYGHWHGVNLSSANRVQFFIPTGFAHGFAVLSEVALLAYKCTEPYSPKDEVTLLWNDPTVGVRWPAMDFVISEKDKNGIRFIDLPETVLFD